MLNFDKLGAAEDVRFQQNAFEIIFFSSSYIFLTLPKIETKKVEKRPTLICILSQWFAQCWKQMTIVEAIWYFVQKQLQNCVAVDCLVV